MQEVKRLVMSVCWHKKTPLIQIQVILLVLNTFRFFFCCLLDTLLQSLKTLYFELASSACTRPHVNVQHETTVLVFVVVLMQKWYPHGRVISSPAFCFILYQRKKFKRVSLYCIYFCSCKPSFWSLMTSWIGLQ